MDFVIASQAPLFVIVVMACAAALCAVMWIGIRLPGQSRTRVCRLDEESRQRRRTGAAGRLPQ